MELAQVQFATNVGAPSVLTFRPLGSNWPPGSAFANTVVCVRGGGLEVWYSLDMFTLSRRMFAPVALYLLSERISG